MSQLYSKKSRNTFIDLVSQIDTSKFLFTITWNWSCLTRGCQVLDAKTNESKVTTVWYDSQYLYEWDPTCAPKRHTKERHQAIRRISTFLSSSTPLLRRRFKSWRPTTMSNEDPWRTESLNRKSTIKKRDVTSTRSRTFATGCHWITFSSHSKT